MGRLRAPKLVRTKKAIKVIVPKGSLITKKGIVSKKAAARAFEKGFRESARARLMRGKRLPRMKFVFK